MILGAFNFQINCPDNVVSSTLTKATNPLNFYDIMNPAAIEIDTP